MSKKYMMIYHDNIEAIKLLSDAEKGRLFMALLEYSRGVDCESETGGMIEQDLRSTLTGNERFLFSIMKIQIDRENQKYEDKCNQNSKNGKKGGAKKGNQNAKKQPKTTERLKKQPKQGNTNTNTNNKNIPKGMSKGKIPFGTHSNVFLAEHQYENLKIKFGEELPEMIEKLSEYIVENGGKYEKKDHNLVLQGWVKDAVRKQKLDQKELDLREKELEMREQRLEKAQTNSHVEVEKYNIFDCLNTQTEEVKEVIEIVDEQKSCV